MKNFRGVFILLAVLLATPLMASDGGATLTMAHGWIAIAAGFAIGLAAFGGAIGQGKAIAAAMEGIARNPGAATKITTPMIIGLALIESLVIYALLIAFLLQAKF